MSPDGGPMLKTTHGFAENMIDEQESKRSAMLELQHISHNYGAVKALRDVSLTAYKGEFLTILGESGSGKTTILRVISGLETATSAEVIAIEGVNVAHVPAAHRNCTTVFQNYALFPHMSVQENVEYGLSVRGMPKADRAKRALEALEMVKLDGKADRRVSQLSGGERQRVALARAIVTQPAILLLDEPLGALDEKLRQQMQEELVRLHSRLGMTFVYITHSQEEALTMSDRIALMCNGEIVQIGTPEDLFDRPNSAFAAEFMGFENIFEGHLKEISDERVSVEVNGHGFHGRWSGHQAPVIGQKAFAAIRAERLKLEGAENHAEDNALKCSAGSTLYRGKYVDQHLQTEIGPMRARIWDRASRKSSISTVSWHPDDCVVTAP
ncbi:MAG: ABC transporter ATP-binding protein [Roseovarius sp.]|nr:ABC transporter ATP-binding protein [Roseovarius sp.]